MAMMLNELRRNYDRLSGLERASLSFEAALSHSEAMMTALTPPGLMEAYSESFWASHILMIAAYGLDQSKTALIDALMGPSDDDPAGVEIVEAGRRWLAWIAALAELGKETRGGPDTGGLNNLRRGLCAANPEACRSRAD
ncbi:MAG: hypothetical protein LBS31_10935 [Candidatus Adiutrix sp.]|jgi:hypothetical protein|nr:hypothetical protein [Candidatus Adiutrix sp.]